MGSHFMMDKNRQKIAQPIVVTFVIAVLVCFPLYTKGMIKIGTTKFAVCCLMFTLFSLVMVGYELLTFHGGAARKAVPLERSCTKALLLFVGANMLSTVFSLSPKLSMWGHSTFFGGLAMVLFTAAGYWFVSKYFPVESLWQLVAAAGISSVIVLSFYLLNTFYIDPLDFYSGLVPDDVSMFRSTVGNADYTGSYLSIILSLVFGGFLFCEEPKSNHAFGVLSCLCTLCLVLVDTDGLLLGLIGAGIVLLCCPRFRLEQLRRGALLGVSLFFWTGFMTWLDRYPTLGGYPVLFSLLSGWFMAGFLFCLVLFGVLTTIRRKWGTEFAVYRIFRPMTLLIGLGCISLLVWCNLHPDNMNAKIRNLLIFSDDWGTGRGHNWMLGMTAWMKANIFRKLIGYGPHMYNSVIRLLRGSSITWKELELYNAHNEFLEQLVTTGLLGFGAWLWLIFSHLRCSMNKMDDPKIICLVAGVVGYLTNSFVNNRMATGFPLLMICLGLVRAILREDTEFAFYKGRKSTESVLSISYLTGAIIFVFLCGEIAPLLLEFIF